MDKFDLHPIHRKIFTDYFKSQPKNVSVFSHNEGIRYSDPVVLFCDAIVRWCDRYHGRFGVMVHGDCQQVLLPMVQTINQMMNYPGNYDTMIVSACIGECFKLLECEEMINSMS